MRGSMVDIQCPTAENRRGKKEERKRRQKPQLQNIVSASAMRGGHKSIIYFCWWLTAWSLWLGA